MYNNTLAFLIKQSSSGIAKLFVRNASSEPIKTCLYDFHVGSGGKMVDFAGQK